MVRYVVLVMALASLVGCESSATDAQTETVTVTANAPVSAQQKATLLQVVAACPGLQRYNGDWTAGAIDPAKGTVEVVINEKLRDMPFDYYATGHHCYFEIDGERVAVWKRPCVSACLDEQSQAPRSELTQIN